MCVCAFVQAASGVTCIYGPLGLLACVCMVPVIHPKVSQSVFEIRFWNLQQGCRNIRKKGPTRRAEKQGSEEVPQNETGGMQTPKRRKYKKKNS